jgi:SAM-dependent methyltransferase
MSSPIARSYKTLVQRKAIAAHHYLSHRHRVEVLARLFAEIISLGFKGRKEVRCIDIGCGDMTIAESIRTLAPMTTWVCTDLHPLPEALKKEAQWKKYVQFDGKSLPFEEKTFQVGLLCDVLHHVRDQGNELLRETARVADIVIVKDHFEEGMWSRTILKMMDVLGNWGYGVSMPHSYLTKEYFSQMCRHIALQEMSRREGIPLYGHLPWVFQKLLNPRWQFVAVLKQKTQQDFSPCSG